MATNKQREASRRQLEEQLRDRQAREARRKRTTLIGSVVGTLVLIIVVVVVIVATTGGDSGKKNPPGANHKPTRTATSAAPSTPSVPTAKGPAVTFDGVTVKGAKDLSGKPVTTSHGTKAAAAVQVKDLVVGKGAKATPTSSVNVQYVGVLYKNGKQFDSSWDRGQSATFSLTGVVKGFTYGIGGTTAAGAQKAIAPMREGGRRIIIVPAGDGYGSAAQGSIPANSDLVFVVDLLKVGAG